MFATAGYATRPRVRRRRHSRERLARARLRSPARQAAAAGRLHARQQHAVRAGRRRRSVGEPVERRGRRGARRADRGSDPACDPVSMPVADSGSGSASLRRDDVCLVRRAAGDGRHLHQQGDQRWRRRGQPGDGRHCQEQAPRCLAVKAGTAVATTFFVEKLAKNHPRNATIIMAVLNTAYAGVVAHNYRVARAQ